MGVCQFVMRAACAKMVERIEVPPGDSKNNVFVSGPTEKEEVAQCGLCQITLAKQIINVQ